MTLGNLLAYVVGMAIWLRLLVFLNHKSGDIFGLDCPGCGTYLCVVFIAVFWPFAVPVVCAVFVLTWLFRSHGEDSDDRLPLHCNKSRRGNRLAGGGKLPVSSAGRVGLAGSGLHRPPQWKENHENRNAKGDAQMRPLENGDPCPCCGRPIEFANPKALHLLTNIRDLLWCLQVVGGAESLREMRRRLREDEV